MMGKMLSAVLRECADASSLNGLTIGYKCPGCGHYHVLPVNDRPDGRSGPRWTWDGNTEKPTISPSIRSYTSDPDGSNERTTCHHFVSEGQIQFCGDSPHTLSGKTVPMVPWRLDDADQV